MSQFAVCSVKGAPGATTLALAMACALSSTSGAAALVEADPAGGDLAGHLGLPTDPGMVSLAAAARHRSTWPAVHGHGQNLPAGGWAILGSTDPAQASASAATLAARLPEALGGQVRDAVIDCGRWTTMSPVSTLMRQMTATAICLRSSVPAIEAVRVRADDLWDLTGGRLGLVVMGPGHYGGEEIEECTGLPVVGVVSSDPRGCSVLFGAATGRADRLSVVRAARSIAGRLELLAPPPSGEPQPAIPLLPNGVRA